MTPDSLPPPKRVSQREVAAAVGCSAMTVSCALRNSPKVLPETRKKILEVAERLGYRPDPEISKLMTHLRQPTRHSFSHNLAFINSWPDREEYLKGYTGEIYQGAKHRAAQLGFDIEPFWLLESGMTARRLSSVLYNRGIRGVLLPPWLNPNEVVQLDWPRFSVVATTMSIANPAVNRVVPHVFRNTLLACEELLKQGYRRIAFIETEDAHIRSEGMSRGAFELIRSTRLPESSPAGLILRDWDDPLLFDWFKAEHPDAIVCSRASVYHKLRKALGGRQAPGFIVLDSMQDERLTAIDQLPGSLGSAAVDVLVAQLLHNESGLPITPKLVMLNGRLRPGNSSPRVESKPAARKKTVDPLRKTSAAKAKRLGGPRVGLR
jgi:DNA-binding LacI/PurR family transcriptional regulator